MSRLFSGTPFDKPSQCPICGKAPADCRCVILPPKKTMTERAKGAAGAQKAEYKLTPENSAPPRDQQAKIRVEKRKGNREVTLITGLDHPGNDLPALLAEFKTKLGAGGAVQARTIELQGDQAKRVAEMLTAKGVKARVI